MFISTMKAIFNHGKYKIGVESNRNVAAEILSGTLQPKLSERGYNTIKLQ